jgi:hypothetical protein
MSESGDKLWSVTALETKLVFIIILITQSHIHYKLQLVDIFLQTSSFFIFFLCCDT